MPMYLLEILMKKENETFNGKCLQLVSKIAS